MSSYQLRVTVRIDSNRRRVAGGVMELLQCDVAGCQLAAAPLLRRTPLPSSYLSILFSIFIYIELRRRLYYSAVHCVRHLKERLVSWQLSCRSWNSGPHLLGICTIWWLYKYHLFSYYNLLIITAKVLLLLYCRWKQKLHWSKEHI